MESLYSIGIRARLSSHKICLLDFDHWTCMIIRKAITLFKWPLGFKSYFFFFATPLPLKIGRSSIWADRRSGLTRPLVYPLPIAGQVTSQDVAPHWLVTPPPHPRGARRWWQRSTKSLVTFCLQCGRPGTGNLKQINQINVWKSANKWSFLLLWSIAICCTRSQVAQGIGKSLLHSLWPEQTMDSGPKFTWLPLKKARSSIEADRGSGLRGPLVSRATRPLIYMPPASLWGIK